MHVNRIVNTSATSISNLSAEERIVMVCKL
jgi:hypothetical protein